MSSLFPEIGIGTYSVPENELYNILGGSIAHGRILIDTAFKYNNEKLIGTYLRKAGIDRERIWLQTKAGSELLSGRRRYLKLDRITVKAAINRACKALQIDYLDVFLLHWAFPGYEKSFMKLLDCKSTGLVRYVGVCNVSYKQLLDLYDIVGVLPDVIQIEVHPYLNNRKLCEFCRKHDVIVEARSPFAHGDALSEWLVDPVLTSVAEKYGATVPQVILRWLTQQDIIPVVRTSNLFHLKENMSSFDFDLMNDDMARIDSINKDMSYGFVSSNNR